MGTLYFAAHKQAQYWVAVMCPVRRQELGWLVHASVGSRGLIGTEREIDISLTVTKGTNSCACLSEGL